MQKRNQKKVIFVIKILVTIIIIFLISKKVDFLQLIRDFQHISFLTVLIIFSTTLIKLFIQFNNWGKYLQLNSDYYPQKNEVLKSYFIGIALHFVLPAGLGFFGKVYFVNNRKSTTAVSVGIERIFVTWKNLFFASFAAIFYFSTFNLFFKIALLILIFLSPFLLYFFSFIINKENLKKFFKNYLKIVPRIIIMQIIFTFISFFQYYIILKDFVKISFFEVMISVPLVHISHILPVSFSGFGMREIFAIEVFSRFNINPEAAITTTLMIFFMNSVLPAFVGAYLLLRTKLSHSHLVTVDGN